MLFEELECDTVKGKTKTVRSLTKTLTTRNNDERIHSPKQFYETTPNREHKWQLNKDSGSLTPVSLLWMETWTKSWKQDKISGECTSFTAVTVSRWRQPLAEQSFVSFEKLWTTTMEVKSVQTQFLQTSFGERNNKSLVEGSALEKWGSDFTTNEGPEVKPKNVSKNTSKPLKASQIQSVSNRIQF